MRKAVVLSKCWFGGRKLKPGDVIVTDVEVLPPYLKELAEDAQPPQVEPVPSSLDDAGTPAATRHAELEAAVLELHEDTDWSPRTGRPKVEAVNRVLAEQGKNLTTAGELQMVQFVRKG